MIPGTGLMAFKSGGSTRRRLRAPAVDGLLMAHDPRQLLRKKLTVIVVEP